MLIMFRVKNFASFKDEAVLDMRATSYKQHLEHVQQLNNDIKVVKTAAIYGANASGKSNFIKAVMYFKNFILRGYQPQRALVGGYGDESRYSQKEISYKLYHDKLSESEFEIVCEKNDDIIQYGFTISETEIISEWYFLNDQKVFQREKTDVEFGTHFERELKMYKKIPEDGLYFSVLEFLLDKNSKKKITDNFIEFLEQNLEIHTGGAGSVFNRAISTFEQDIYNDASLIKEIEQDVKKIDVGIKRFEIKEEKYSRLEQERIRKVLKTVHDMYDAKGDITGEVEFGLENESAGTRKFLDYAVSVIRMIEKGGVVVIDELSSSMHVLLTQYVINKFQHSSNSKAQLIFTTHDVSLLTKEQFRRDEIIFVDKNEKGESSMYSLSDLKVRDDATFNKDYLQGKYGAIPVFTYDL